MPLNQTVNYIIRYMIIFISSSWNMQAGGFAADIESSYEPALKKKNFSAAYSKL